MSVSADFVRCGFGLALTLGLVGCASSDEDQGSGTATANSATSDVSTTGESGGQETETGSGASGEDDGADSGQDDGTGGEEGDTGSGNGCDTQALEACLSAELSSTAACQAPCPPVTSSLCEDHVCRAECIVTGGATREACYATHCPEDAAGSAQAACVSGCASTLLGCVQASDCDTLACNQSYAICSQSC